MLSLDVCVRLCDELSDFGCHTVGRRCGGDCCRYGGIAAAQRLRAGELRAAVSEARSLNLVDVRLPNIKASASLLNHGCAWTHADAANPYVQIADRFGFGENLDANQSPLFDSNGQMPETANLRLDAAYGRLQAMIEEVEHANRETPQSEAYSHSGAIE